MSPEQVNGQPLDSRSDIYSFGIMAWQMLAGRPPFTGETAIAVAVKHLNDKPPSLTEFRADIPAPLRDLIKRMISKKKEDRPADFSIIINELKQMIRQVTGKEDATLTLKAQSQQPSIFDRPFRSQIGWLIGACFLVLASSCGIGWAMRTPDPLKVVSNGHPKVAEMQSADAQLYWAVTNPQEEAAWVAVKKFPKGASSEMIARATANLGLIYLKTNRLSFAHEAFNELAMDPKYKANGLAGQALHAKLTDDVDAAKKLLAQIDQPGSKLFPEMETAVKDLRKRLEPAK